MRQKPNPLTKIIRIVTGENASNYETAVESFIAGVVICLIVMVSLVMLGVIGAFFS